MAFNPWASLADSQKAALFAPPQPAPLVMPVSREPVQSSLVQPPVKASARPMPMAPRPVLTPAVEAEIAKIQGARGNMQNQMAGANAGLEAQLAEALGRDFQTDLTPLAALVDEWSGSQMAGSYQAPESVSDRRKEVGGLQSQLSQGRMGMAAQDLQNLQSDLSQRLGFNETDFNRAYQANKDATDNYWKELEYALSNERLNIDKSKAKGGKDLPNLPAGSVERITDAESSVNETRALEDLIAQNEKLMGPFEGLLTKNPYETEHKILDSKFKIVSQTVGKFLEGGKLMKEDEKKYEEMLPKARDTPEVARGKLSNVLALLEQRNVLNLENLSRAGYNTSGFEGTQKAAEKRLQENIDSQAEAAAEQKVLAKAREILANPVATPEQKAKAQRALMLGGG